MTQPLPDISKSTRKPYEDTREPSQLLVTSRRGKVSVRMIHDSGSADRRSSTCIKRRRRGKRYSTSKVVDAWLYLNPNHPDFETVRRAAVKATPRKRPRRIAHRIKLRGGFLHYFKQLPPEFITFCKLQIKIATAHRMRMQNMPADQSILIRPVNDWTAARDDQFDNAFAALADRSSGKTLLGDGAIGIPAPDTVEDHSVDDAREDRDDG